MSEATSRNAPERRQHLTAAWSNKSVVGKDLHQLQNLHRLIYD